jgi:hypothetical protein
VLLLNGDVRVVVDKQRRRLDPAAVVVLAEEDLDRAVVVLLRAIPYEAMMSGWSSKASEAESKGVEVCRD